MATAIGTPDIKLERTAERPGPFLAWPEVGVVPLIVCALLLHPLGDAMTLQVGSLTVQWIDVGLAVVVGATAAAAMVCPPRLDMPAVAGTAVLVLSLVLAYPIVIGLAEGRAVESVLRQGRVAVYWASFFLVWQLVWNRRAARNLLLLISWLVGLGAAYALLAHVMGWEWENAMSVWVLGDQVISRGFGWWSAMPWYPYGAVIAIAYAWLSDAPRARRWPMGALGVALVVATLSTYIRGDLVGLLAGLSAVAALSWRTWDRFEVLWRRFRTAVPVALLVLATALAATWSSTGSVVRLVGIRALSIINADAYSGSGAATRKDRLTAMREGLRYAWDNWLGIGYGVPREGETRLFSRLTYWASHNFLSWTGFYLGLAGLVIAVAALVVIAWTLASVARHHGEHDWAPVAAFGVFAALVGQSLASTVFFDSMYQYPLVPVLLVIGLRSAVADRDQWLSP